MRSTIYLLLAIVAASLIGCASEPHAATDNKPHSECLVCKFNADMACIDVAVDDQTPHCTYNAKEYYFCSTHCRDKFAKNPTKYVAK